MMPSTRAVLVCAALALTSPALAHHRQTDPVVPLTFSGNTPLPRLATASNRTLALAVQASGGRQIVSISPWMDRQNPALQTLVAPAGDHDNPVVSVSGRAFAYESGSDPVGTGLPGDQIVGVHRTTPFAVSDDPTGTSINASIDGTGNVIAFESTGDLAGTGNPSARQVFVSDRDGSIRQLSTGVGTSRHVVLGAKRRLVAFESSSNPTTGADTGIAQIWVGDISFGDVAPITAGLGPSRNAAISNDGRIVAFESTADLADSQADTGVPQIFIYETKSKTYAQLTSDPGGCTLPSAFKVQRDWRVTYVCGGLPYYTMLRANERFLVPTGGTGVTQRIVTELGIHFLILSTTSNLQVGSGTTPGNQVYLVNLFKRPATPVAGSTTWFPTQGVPPL